LINTSFIRQITSAYQNAGYLIQDSRQIPGVNADLWVKSARKLRLGFARVWDHNLWINWEGQAEASPQTIRRIYQSFSEKINMDFQVPHALRMTIPNLTLVAYASTPFPADIISFAQEELLHPWYGGEVGQLILVNTANHVVTSLKTLSVAGNPKPGAISLGYAADMVRGIAKDAANSIGDVGK
jgi:hypothetical protein